MQRNVDVRRAREAIARVIVPGHPAVCGELVPRDARRAFLDDLDDEARVRRARVSACGRDCAEVVGAVGRVCGRGLDRLARQVDGGIVLQNVDLASESVLLRREHEPVGVRGAAVVDDLRLDVGARRVDGVGELTQRRRVRDVDRLLGACPNLEAEHPVRSGDARRVLIDEAWTRDLVALRELQDLH